MSRLADRAAVAGKIEWEGGIWETLDYGLGAHDMPEGDTELIAAWDELYAAFGACRAFARKVEDLLAEQGDAS